MCTYNSVINERNIYLYHMRWLFWGNKYCWYITLCFISQSNNLFHMKVPSVCYVYFVTDEILIELCVLIRRVVCRCWVWIWSLCIFLFPTSVSICTWKRLNSPRSFYSFNISLEKYCKRNVSWRESSSKAEEFGLKLSTCV